VVLPDFSAIIGRQQAEVFSNSLARETIRENNIRNHRVADFMQDRDADIAARLRSCHRLLQRKGDYYQSSMFCRQTRLCANCHVIRSRYTQERFSEAVATFSSRQGVKTRLLSFVLHPEAKPELSLSVVADVISRFGQRLEWYRTRHNNSGVTKREVLGPVMLSSHLQPAAKFTAPGGFRMSHSDKMHLHILLGVHDRAVAKDIAAMLERLWVSAQYSDHRQMDMKLKREKLELEDAEHEANLIAYLARHIKPVWNPRQVIQAYDLAATLSRSSLCRLMGASGVVRKLPSRLPLIGEAIQFNSDGLNFEPVFLSQWTH